MTSHNRPNLPYDADAETVLLANCILTEGLEPLGDLKENEFFAESNRKIFRILTALHERHVPVNMPEISRYIQAHEGAEAFPLLSQLNTVLDGAPVLARDWPHYRERIRKLAQERISLKEASAIGEAVAEGQPVSEIVKRARSFTRTASGLGKPPKQTPSPAVHSSFHVTDGGVFYHDPSGENEPLRICSRLDVIAETRDEGGEGWGRLLNWTDSEGRTHIWALPMALLAGAGDEYRGRLLDGGLEISPGRKARELLTTYVQTANCESRARSVSKLGWHGQVFVLPDATIGVTAKDEELIFQSPLEAQHFLKTAGSLEIWREQVARVCSGNSRLLFAVSCAFAAPLLGLSKDECGGFHFHGPTSTGKSTALLVAGSVWGGGGRNGFIESWRTTINGLEGFGELHNDGLGCLDEISQLDAREATECLYLLANGQGKQRMTKTLGLRRRLTWTNLLLSSGEITLGEHSETIGKRAKTGAEIRLVNLSVDAGADMGIFEDLHGFEDPETLARHLRDAARTTYGNPIREFLQYVVKNRLGVEDRLRSQRASFLAEHLPASCSGEVTRAAGRFALAAIGGELATELGITGWRSGEAAEAAARCLSEWIAARGTIGRAEIEAALRQVRAFLEAHGASRFQSARPRLNSVGEEIPERIINRAGFKREDAEGATQYLVLPEVFRTEVCAGFDYRMVARTLGERGYLASDNGRLMTKPRLPELGLVWVYAIGSGLLEG